MLPMGQSNPPPPSRSQRPVDATCIFVTVADLRHATAPDVILTTLGLGSCLGITCYDPLRRIGGMLHTMLPDSRRHRRENPPPAMYLNLGLPALINGMVELGASMPHLQFKVFGGARILQSNDYFSVGRKNVEMMEQFVDAYRLNVRHWDVGGQTNRSIDLYISDGRVALRMPGQPEKWL